MVVSNIGFCKVMSEIQVLPVTVGQYQCTTCRDRVWAYLYSFFYLGARCARVVNTTSWPLYPWERDQIPIVRVWVGRSVRVRKISPALGFDPRTIQSVASCYTDKYVGRNITQMFNEAAHSQLSCFVRNQKTNLITSPL